MTSSDEVPEFESMTTERSHGGGRLLGGDAPPSDPQVTVIDAREEVTHVDSSASTDSKTVEQFLADTDFDREFVAAIQIPVPQTQCYTVAVEGVSIADDRLTLEATVERERPECLDAPTVLTCFVRVHRRPAPANISLDLDDAALPGDS